MKRSEAIAGKLAGYAGEVRALRDDGRAYALGFGLVLLVGLPFLLLEVAIVAISGRDPGWFPADSGEAAADTASMTGYAIIDELEARAVPALALTRTAMADGFSRLGGCPSMPAEVVWPAWRGTPLAFLAQIDFAELDADGIWQGVRRDGRLYFFYDPEQRTWGFDPNDRGSWRVLYAPGNAEVVVRPPPPGLPPNACFAEVPIAARRVTSYPSLDRVTSAVQRLSKADWAVIESFLEAAPAPCHQLGGFPDPIQGDAMEEECQLASNGIASGDIPSDDDLVERLLAGAEDWTLLLQLGSDDDAGMMWGDVGSLYFFIRRQDLVQNRFDDVWMVLQCC